MPQSPGAKFRVALQSAPLMVPGVFNAFVAKMAERIGFQAAYQSGAVVSAGITGVPDIGLVNQVEFADQARLLTQAVEIPVISDADTGFGEALAVERTVQLFESVGLAGLHLEDQILPKRCGHLSGKTLVSKEEMVGKIKAAVAAKRDPDFVIIARTDARSVNDLADALARSKACADAGADMIFPEALESKEEFERFANEIDVPLMANMTEFGKSPLFTVEELDQMGYKAVLFPVTVFRQAMKAAEDGLKTVFENGTQKSLLDKMQTRAELYDYLDYEGFQNRDRSYFGS